MSRRKRKKRRRSISCVIDIRGKKNDKNAVYKRTPKRKEFKTLVYL